MEYEHPRSFIKLQIENINIIPNLYAYSVGYENKKWRTEQLASHVMEWLPEFSLKYSEIKNLRSENAVRLIRQAARNIYESENYKSRGEFGEILLHILIRQTKQTMPAISKIYFKDARNDTVKGFDCVHVVANDTKFELWLGEVKFYSDINQAIYDVCEELEKHTQTDYLRNEFSAIINKIDEKWSHADRLKKLLDENTSLDEIFDSACIPVLLTYDSKVIASFDKVCMEYEDAFKAEVEEKYQKFTAKLGQLPIIVHLFLLPLDKKKELNNVLNESLKRLQ
jgi:hypothetical protein